MNQTEIIVQRTDGIINVNFDEVKAYLNGQLEHYRGLVFTEETKKDAKDTVAELRKMKASVEDKRKEVKKLYMVPYDKFDKQMKELSGLIEEPISFINGQIDEMEKKRKAEKRKEIEELYAENVAEEFREILPLDRIYNPKWENATYELKAITDDIQIIVLDLRKNIEIIKSMKEECEEEALKALYSTLKLEDGINYINRYRADKEAVLARQKAAEEAKRAEEERKAEEARKAEEIPVAVTESPVFQDIESNLEKKVAVYEVDIQDEFDTNLIESLFDQAGLTYRRVN